MSANSDPAILSALARPLVSTSDSTLDPRFFLASTDERVWIPRIVVVRQRGAVAGMVYAKERKLGGFPTGLIYADATLGKMVVSAPGDRGEIFRAALAALISARGVRGVRILVPPGGFEFDAIQEIATSIPRDVTWVNAENHSYLPLPGSYDAFLNSLGAKTRRNFRYYRRRSEDLGHKYFDSLNLETFAEAARDLLEESVIGGERNGVERALKIFATVDRPVLAGLRDQEGRWAGILGGWQEADNVTVFLQMNHEREHAGNSLSLVLRGYLIERLIESGVRNLRFWAGSGGALQRYVVQIPTMSVYIDEADWAWRTLRSISKLVIPLFPKRMGWIAQWISPCAAGKFRED
jgi:hypothetical protein